jgi:hypothetical protein
MTLARFRSASLAALTLLLLQLPLGSMVVVCGSHLEAQSTAVSSAGLIALIPPHSEDGCDGTGDLDSMGSMSCSILFCPLSSPLYAPEDSRRPAIEEQPNAQPAIVDISPDFPPPRSALL